MTRVLTIVLFASLAGCYPASPMAVRTGADKASQAETNQHWEDMRETGYSSRQARREEAKALEARDAKK